MVHFESNWIRFDYPDELIHVKVKEMKKTVHGKDFLVVFVEEDSDNLPRLINIAPFQVDSFEEGYSYVLKCSDFEKHFISIQPVQPSAATVEETSDIGVHDSWVVHDTANTQAETVYIEETVDREGVNELISFFRHQFEQTKNEAKQYQKIIELLEELQ